MDREEFAALVARMETVASASPAAYRWRVLGWAALGYGFLVAVVLGLLAICIAIVWSIQYLKVLSVKLLIFVLPGLFVLVRALWVRFDPPDGVHVTRNQAPQLFAMLAELRRELKTPRIHAVLITPELNAAVTQVPRLGFLGWHRNYLMLGLPLLQGLTVEQFKAVLAHELGHLSRGHARVGNWIYRLRMIWARLDEVYSQQSQVGAAVVRRFFSWYSPRFNATSFPFARANEYEADAAAVRLTSSASAAQALTGINVLARFLDQKYWPDIHGAARERPEPAFSPYAAFRGMAVLEIPEAERSRWLADALARVTSTADTHPALKDRLAAIGSEAQFAPPAAGAGAESLLGAALPELQQHFDAEWRERVGESWRQFHEDTRKARERLAEIHAQGEPAEPTAAHLLEHADLEERVGGGEAAALALRRAAFARFPDQVEVRFALGRQLLAAADAEGVSLIEPLVEQCPGSAPTFCELLRDYYWGKGEKAAARNWHERLQDEAARLHAARRERETLRTNDAYLPHGLPDAELHRVVTALRAIPSIRRAYLVRKQTRNSADAPFFAFGYCCSRRFAPGNRRRIAATLAEIQAAVEFQGETMIISLERDNKAFESVFRKVEGARIL